VCFREDLLHNVLGILGVTKNTPRRAIDHCPVFANKDIPIDHFSPHVAVNRLYQYVKAEAKMSVRNFADFGPGGLATVEVAMVTIVS
jgi:hypothetical protein